MKFYELAIDARFVFRGRRFEKIGMGMANDEHGHGSIFMGETEVAPEGVPLLLPPEEAARMIDTGPSTLVPRPGQGRQGRGHQALAGGTPI